MERDYRAMAENMLPMSNFTAQREAAENLIIVFARYPQPGRCKTRLIPALGANGAADVHTQMVERTLRWSAMLAKSADVATQVRFTGGSAEEMAAVIGKQHRLISQGDGDLGARLERAVSDAFRAGGPRVVVVGTDCPAMSSELARQAFGLLSNHNVVLGPATDGGYYLIGLSQPCLELFRGMDWGTDRVLWQTLRIAQDRNLTVSLLPTLADVDRPEDLAVWERVAQTDPSRTSSPKVSVVIPTLNKEPQLPAVVEAVSAEKDVETIIAAAGHVWDSLSVAVRYQARFVTSRPGRARQMNAAASVARGRVLLFLHADTLVPAGFADEAFQLVTRRPVAAGAFRLAIDAAGWRFRLIEQGVWARSRLLQMPYGDQAIFLRRELFHKLGGFSDLPVMEDFEFMRRLRRHGRIAVLPARVKTSARRWIKQGVWRTTWMNQCMVVAYLIGVPCSRLAKWYRDSTIRHVGNG